MRLLQHVSLFPVLFSGGTICTLASLSVLCGGLFDFQSLITFRFFDFIMVMNAALGLSIIQKRVENHGGDVLITDNVKASRNDNVPSHGVNIHVTWPKRPVEIPKDTPQPSQVSLDLTTKQKIQEGII